ncbi:MAG: ribonuclease Z [Bacteroidota bacterium]
MTVFFWMKFQVHILGCGSALPTLLRNQSGQIININESEYMIDCGEGTQLMMRKLKKRFQKIATIFISHLHGDHYYGLMGYLSTLHLLGREKEMKIFAPKGLKEIIEVHQKHSNSYFRFPLTIIELESPRSELIYEDKKVNVYTVPLKHKIYCNGFLFKEKQRDRNILPEKIKEYSIPLIEIKNIKKGDDFKLPNGQIIKNSELTKDAPSPKSYAYCSDTSFNPDNANLLNGVNALYHEATFLEKDKDRAVYTKHSTAKEAGQMAKLVNAEKLIIGHFSARYTEFDALIDEAKSVFPSTIAAEDGITIEL